MTQVIVMTYLVTALTFSIHITFVSCLVVFIDLKRIKFDKIFMFNKTEDWNRLLTLHCHITYVYLFVNDVTSRDSAVTMFNDGKSSVGKLHFLNCLCMVREN